MAVFDGIGLQIFNIGNVAINRCGVENTLFVGGIFWVVVIFVDLFGENLFSSEVELGGNFVVDIGEINCEDNIRLDFFSFQRNIILNEPRRVNVLIDCSLRLTPINSQTTKQHQYLHSYLYLNFL